MVELMGQLDLLDLLRHLVVPVPVPYAYVVELSGAYVKREAVAFTWSCSCGETSAPDVRWSHADLADRMGRKHGGAA